MGKKKKTDIKNNKLRKLAGERLQNYSENPEILTPEKINNLLHELRVHQVELEIQNEELRGAQRALDKEREKYLDLFDSAPVGYLTLNKKYFILQANMTVSSMLGVNRSKLINQPLAGFILEEDRRTYYEFIRRYSAAGNRSSCELRMKKTRDSWFNADLEISELTGEDEETILYRCCIIDTTLTKTAETELKKYREHLEVLLDEKTNELNKTNDKLSQEIAALKHSEKTLLNFESNINEAQELAHVGSWRLETSTGKIYWSDETYRLFGWVPGEEVSYDRYINAVFPEDRELVRKGLIEALEGIIPFENEHRIVRKGEIRIHHSIGRIYRDENGNPVRIVGSVQDVTERELAKRELQRNKEELHKLTQHLQTIREEERARISRGIHDDLGQMLTALKMDLAWLRKETGLCDKKVQNKIDTMSGIVDSTMQSVQRLAADLRPGILDDLGLPAAIEWLTEEIQKRTDISIELINLPENISLEEHLSITIFRIIQESLTNIVRHSKATKVKISLEESGRDLLINVKDNGIGIPVKKISDSNSLGLIGIRERVRPWNGLLEIKSEDNAGTEVSIKLQLK